MFGAIGATTSFSGICGKFDAKSNHRKFKYDVPALGEVTPERAFRIFWRRTPFFRSPLMVIRPDKDPAFRRASTTWSALKGEKLISLRSFSPIQRIVDKHLAQAGVVSRQSVSINLLDTQIAMVEADEGIAIIPSFGLPACRNRRVVTSRLINPVVEVEFHQISNRGKKLPAGADEFSTFLKSFFARELAASVPRSVVVGTHDTSSRQSKGPVLDLSSHSSQ